MNVGLGIENDVSVAHLMPAVRGVNDALKACFSDKEYGADLIDITIGMILVTRTTISDRFHPVRPFKYKRLDRVKHPGTGQIMEFHNSASWDVKPDFETFSSMGLEGARGYLCETLIASTGCLDEHHSEFPDFDVSRFRADFESCLQQL
ncbi:MAG: hypothetical protein ACOH1Q_12595 [Thiobacillus sp.]